MADTIDDLKKKAPNIDGVELVKIIKPRKPMNPDEKVTIFMPFTDKSDYQPADAYKTAVKGFARQGVDDKYLLLSSVRKLSEKYNSVAVVDLKEYTHGGLKEDMTDDQKRKTIENNFAKNKPVLETIVRNFDNAWAEPETPGVVTPPMAYDLYDDATHTIPDEQGVMLQNSLMLQQFIIKNGSNRDKKNMVEGKQFYVMRYKEIENEGKKALTVDYVEVWQKKK
jgi:hypothetical protein